MASDSQEAAERIEFLRVPDLPGMELMSVQNSSRLYRFFHESFDICVVPEEQPAAGVVSHWRFRRWQQVAHPGCLMLTEPGDAHVTMKVPQPANYWVALFAPGLIAAAAADLGLRRAVHLVTCQAVDVACTAHLELLRKALTGESTVLERQSLLTMCLQLLLRGYAQERPKRLLRAGARQLTQARDFIVAHHDQSITLDDLVAVTGLSRFHLIRSFAQQFGLPPHQFLIRVRIERARALLRAGIPPEHVTAGFADQSHFIRFFKRVVGVTPAAYQRQVRT